ncbi:hypothetical protein HG536_0D04210 [Torulaspora globosa]|uniref:ER membrane protein complex subunit 10 n=1 Tax=Torulaspora globosa TaxID=48254 RepID=A0A7G3ZHB3_9SACH|nr:uncharacterized protein HG536_0D04210 [Torulaspora globosa]QLL32899.1 hypothetical protein HG536_0D04210 [Torulaspora globosa]
MRLGHLSLLALAPLSVARELSLIARQTTSGQQVSLGAFDYDEQANTVARVSGTPGNLQIQGAVCVDASFDQGAVEFPCFSFLELQDPLHYSLILELHDKEISKLSLVYDPEVDGVTPAIRRPEAGPEAPAIKLKKITKTYRDKRAAKNAATAQYEDNEEVDTRSWMQKNWKMLVIGLVAYNIIAITGRQQQRQE